MSQHKRQEKKSNIFRPQRKGLSIVMKNSEQSEQKSPNSDPTVTPNMHTPLTNTTNTADTITTTKSDRIPTQPVSHLANMNPSGQQTGLPGPDIPGLDQQKKSSTAKPKKEIIVTGDELTASQRKVAVKFTELYATIGIFVASADAYDGMVILRNAEARAMELVRAARHDKRVMSFLERIANGSDVGALVIGHVLMFYAIASHHGIFKANPVLLAQLGYHEQQILQPPEGLEGMQNGSTSGQPVVANHP